ncbi:DUF2087 domain-containing protein [Micromonospora sp. CPCC 205561]|uniref:DUF2087 domain-containing protein n=1 Tax=Micromonospora sp. CPCC 205561 TaxID=3122407 RepID=UPI002FF0326C
MTAQVLAGALADDVRRRVFAAIVLAHLARSFEPGVRYPERAVDEVLRGRCEAGGCDHVALPRRRVVAGPGAGRVLARRRLTPPSPHRRHVRGPGLTTRAWRAKTEAEVESVRLNLEPSARRTEEARPC